MNEPSVLVIDVRPGEVLALSGIVTVELIRKSGQLARLRVTAPREVSIEKRDAPNGSVPSMSI